MGRIAVVTDSTCDLGPARLAELGVEMVPLKVHFDDQTFLDWIDLPPEEFYPRLESSPRLPTTSQPSPQEFSAVYKRLAGEGAEGIVSVHLSSKLSGTCESATIAAKDSPVPVRVVDSLLASAGTALIVLAACAARDAGGDLDAVERATLDRISGTELIFSLDTLDYLVKGGRAGRAQGLAASLLNIKPLLELRAGVIEPFGRAKGMRRSLQMLADRVAARSAEVGRLEVVVLHAVAPDLGDQLVAALTEAGADFRTLESVRIGAVIGTHVGPKAVGVSYHPEA